MVRRVRRASSMLQGIAARSSPSRQTAAESRETSVPQPSAIPTSLAARARGVVDPVADHADRPEFLPCQRDGRGLAETSDRPSSRGDRGVPQRSVSTASIRWRSSGLSSTTCSLGA